MRRWSYFSKFCRGRREVILIDYDDYEAINFAQKSDVIIAGGRIKIDKKFIENCKNLKLILSQSTGTDHLCLKTIKKRKIKLIHIGKNLKLIKNFTATSEMSFALLLSKSRKL